MTRYTPEQRANLLYVAGALNDAPPDVQRVVAQQIRAAEHAALEDAAKTADDEYQHQLDQRGPHVAFIMEPVAAAIRALKSRAPRARRKS